MPNNVFAPGGIPTPPASPASFSHGKFNQQAQQYYTQQPTPVATPTHSRPHFQPPPPQAYVPVAPEDRIGTFLSSTLMLQSIIGTGAYGVVYEAVDTKTNIRYAVKALSKLNPDGTPLDARQVEYQTREIRLHYTASAHPNVVSMLKIIDAFPDCLYVVLEYCPEGDLFYNITECGQFVGKDELARTVFLQILDAVQYLHHSGIYHRDLKPENILVTDNGETLKLADFGLATASDRSEDYGCGSTFYMSPECLGQTSKHPYYYCAPNDVWSLGVILVNLTCGRNPWKQASVEDSTYRAYTRHAGFLKTILPLTNELDDILARIFTVDPDERISLSELRQRILECPRFTQPAPAPAQEVPVVAAQPQPQQQQQPVIVCSTPVVAPECAVYEYDEDEDLFEDNASFAPTSPASSHGAASDCETESDMSCSTDACSLIDDDDEMDMASQCQNMPLTPPPPMLAAHPPPPHNVADMMYAGYEHDDASMMAMDVSAPVPYTIQQQQQQFMFHTQPVFHQPMPEYHQPIQQQQQQQQPLPTMCVPQPAVAPNQHQPIGSKFWGWFGKPLQMHLHQQINHIHPFQNQVFFTSY